MSLRFLVISFLIFSSMPSFGFVTTHVPGNLVAPCGTLPGFGADGSFGCPGEDALFRSHSILSDPYDRSSYYLAKGGFIQVATHFLGNQEPNIVAQLSPSLLQEALSDYLVTTINSEKKEKQNYQLLVCLKQRMVFSCYKKDIDPLLPSPYITEKDLVFKSRENADQLYAHIVKTDFFYFATLDTSKVLRIYRSINGPSLEIQSFDGIINVIHSGDKLLIMNRKEVITFTPDNLKKDGFHQAYMGQANAPLPPIRDNILTITSQGTGDSLLYFYPDRVEFWIVPGLLMKKKRVLLVSDFFFVNESLYFKVATIPFNGISKVRNIDQILFRDMYVIDKSGVHKLERIFDSKTYNDGTYQFTYFDRYTTKQISRGATVPAKEVSFKDIFSIDIESSPRELQKHLYSFDRELIQNLSSPTNSGRIEALRKYLLVTFIQSLQYPSVKEFVASSSLAALKNGFQKEATSGRLVFSENEKTYLADLLVSSFNTALSLYKPEHKDVISTVLAQDLSTEAAVATLLEVISEYSHHPYLSSRAQLQVEILRLIQSQ